MRQLLITIMVLSLSFSVYGQRSYRERTPDVPKFQTPLFAVKSNLLYDFTATLNLGVEYRLSPSTTLDLSVNYNPWTYSDNKKFKHLLIQPEYRWWFYESFYGHYLGAHLLYSHYNVGGIELPLEIYPSLITSRYQGDLIGFGVSYGYQWYLGRRWNLEGTLGAGYVYSSYKEYECQHCGAELGSGSKNYIGITKLGISLVYIIK